VTPVIGHHLESITGCGGSLNGNTFTTAAITSSCTVNAIFTIDTYTVTPFAGENGSISPEMPQTVNYGTTASFTILPDTGYEIDSVSGCAGTLSGNTYMTDLITSDCSIMASFKYIIVPAASADPSGGTYLS